MKFNLDNYETVETRLAKFWEQNPNGRVSTSIFHYDETRVVVKTEIYRDISDTHPVSTGFAEEVRDASPVNRTSHVENAETSSTGRALANWTFAAKASPRPSRQEMEKVERMTETKPTEARPDADLVTKFKDACVKAKLDPQDVAKAAGVDLFELTNDSMPKLRDAFKVMQAKPIASENEFVSQVQAVFPTKDKENYRAIKEPNAPATPAQLGKLRAVANGKIQNKADQLDKVSDIVNRPIKKLDMLTKAEADMAIKYFDPGS